MARDFQTPHLNKKAGGFGSIVDAPARGRAVDLWSSYYSTTGTAIETAEGNEAGVKQGEEVSTDDHLSETVCYCRHS